jgi:hypothetical protein
MTAPAGMAMQTPANGSRTMVITSPAIMSSPVIVTCPPVAVVKLSAQRPDGARQVRGDGAGCDAQRLRSADGPRTRTRLARGHADHPDLRGQRGLRSHP